MSRAAVLGSPITHSLSPVLHRTAYEWMGLRTWSYEAYECDEDGLAAFLGSLEGDWAGLSLTMPLKRTALKLADTCSELAVAVGGANTILFSGGRTHAENTDVYGIVTALTEAGAGAPASALVLGGGATAAAALAALRELGLGAVTLAVRDRSRAAEACAAGERLGIAVSVRALDELPGLLPVDLVVSTLPSGAADRYAETIAGSGAPVLDVVYAPWPTILAAAVERAGGTVIGGLPMLLHQAVRQVQLMTGRPEVPLEAMRSAARAEQLRRS
ncbi:MAG: Shikimate dehydrogenase substrate binding domain protein [Actinomycetia bacterium]|nr:Shikimate dehydrogenase substrate binding domain protein [Actinomycetes bacterium]